MTNAIHFDNRTTLDGIIQRSIQIYRWAVMAAFAFVGAGFLVALVSDETVATEMGSPQTLVRQLFDAHASGFFGIGIGIMILAPIVMIAAAAVDFFRAGDRRYALITTAVTAILTLSIALSFVIG